MPETAVHEDGEALASENEIWSAREGPMAAPSGDTGSAKNRAQL